MKKLLLLLFVLSSIVTSAQRVALFSYGEPDTPEYEEFSFWVKANKRAQIIYTYGKDMRETPVTYLSKSILNGEDCFTVKFSNNYTLYIIPKDGRLKVSDLPGKYLKYFFWKYEGPVNGIGTYCEPCAGEEDSFRILDLYFLK